jgi:excisionase family DNA binding protein
MPTKTDAPARFLTLAEVAQELGVHRDTVHRWVAEGHIPALQPGGPQHAIRIDRNDLRSDRRGEEDR